jgi:sugar phosphate isomerase/epimerase
MYKFGWCRSIDDAYRLREAGFDYIEVALASLPIENDSELREALPRYMDSPIPVRAFNVFFPGDLFVVGPHTDDERIGRYLHHAADFMGKLGAGIAVLGSGRSRSVPEGWEPSRAEDQLLRLLERISDEFQGTGITLAVEPLNKKETNLINSVAEAVSFAKTINRPNVRVLADFYHMDEEQEQLHTLVEHKDWLAHIHLADTHRNSPGTGRYPYKEFAAQLKASGYSGMISAECSVKEPDAEFAASLAYLKQIFHSTNA